MRGTWASEVANIRTVGKQLIGRIPSLPLGCWVTPSPVSWMLESILQNEKEDLRAGRL
jgi:hypothetical protein